MLDDGFKLSNFQTFKLSFISKEVEGKEKIERYWCYRFEFSVQTTRKPDIQYATPVTSYIQIWLKNLVTVFGNAMETNVRRINLHTKEQKFGNVKIAHFALFSSSFRNTKEC